MFRPSRRRKQQSPKKLLVPRVRELTEEELTKEPEPVEVLSYELEVSYKINK